MSRGKLWIFRCAGLVLVPVVCFSLLELGLRLAGFGQPTSFLVPFSLEGKRALMQNNQFGWRFFGPQMARTPYPISITQTKTPDTVRIFVFGESAAYGDPQPRFGLPRMLQAFLELRYPGVRFEIVNAAMTGINSHVILPIARGCASAGGDIWVLYMGNNEVVGPFGAGTIFGPRTPALPLVRARLAFLTTRTGQLLDALIRRIRPPPLLESEWGGMKMFLDRPVRASDPQLETVYHHYAHNLQDIVQIARRNGIGLVVSTVASNLRDCGPFKSVHGANLSPSDTVKWQSLYQKAGELMQTGNYTAAAEGFRQAATLDNDYADLHFYLGEVALRLNQTVDAQQQFQTARDNDTLRFRCDTRLNELIRNLSTGRAGEGVQFIDAERVFAQHSPNGLPGQELFLDHVHFTFQGTYLLAQVIAGGIEPLLPAAVRARVVQNRELPSVEACAKRLAWTDWSQQSVLLEILRRLSDAPFTGQVNHESQVQGLKRQLLKLNTAIRGNNLNSIRAASETAAMANPGDGELQQQLAQLLQETDNLAGAEKFARRAVALLPTSAEAWSQLGLIQAGRQQFAEAATSFRRSTELDQQDVSSVQNLAQTLVKLGDRDGARREYWRALTIKPRFGLAWLGLGQILEELGDKSAAEDCYRRALANPIRRPPELLIMARFCQRRGRYAEAVTNYSEAIRLNPLDPKPYLEIGQTLGALGRNAEAAARYADLVQVVPEFTEGHFLYGRELGRLGRPKEAAAQFREAARLNPDLLEAQLNLGIALFNAGTYPEALAEFESVLEQSPTNAIALRYAQQLRLKVNSSGTRVTRPSE
jgi:tetratricopeptide (TPR) repeat protein